MESLKKKKEKIKGATAFLETVEEEIHRCRKFGHRATFMLLEPVQERDIISNSYKSKLHEKIKQELRGVDSVFLFGENLFAAVLPDTHEGGGESAAVRLKRRLSKQASDSGTDLAWSIGVMSIGPDFAGDEKFVLEELEKDLARDRVCQSLVFPGADKQLVAGRYSFRCILLDDGWSRLDSFVKGSASTFQTTVINRRDLEYDFPSMLSQASTGNVVLISPTRSDLELSTILKILRKYQRLSHIPAILLDREERQFQEIQMVLDPDLPVKTLISIVSGLARCLSGGLQAGGMQKYSDVLSSISAATHQLNQPLQIIAGKMELALMDLESCQTSHEKVDLGTRLAVTLKEVRDQALHAANINSKINRLTKI